MTRPPETAALDPWAEQMLLQEKRLNTETEARIRAEEAAAGRKHERREQLWDVVGWVAGILAVGAVVLGFVWLIIGAYNNSIEQNTEQSRARASQVQACTELPEPLERQYCIISLNLEEKDADG